MEVREILTAGLCAAMAAACTQVPAPEPILPVPTSEQIAWQKIEYYAFVHFGLNTFNDLEWGYGNTPAQTFNPTNLDCEQWVSIIKAAGMKGVILTAKHHDGFCLWPTKTVDYNISNSPYKNGKGDMVKELSDACHKHGLEFGLYLSPWDRHHTEYGREGYQKVYHQQINELISNYGPLFEFWFDGANGGNGWYGGANETRSINPNQYYGYEKAREMIKEKHPTAMIFGGTVPDIRWIGNENGRAGETCWAMYDYSKEKHYREAQWGMEDGQHWLPGECDVSIRPGWFYHDREDHQVKSVPQLVDLYYRSVGHNANFLLNFPVALNGRIHPTDSAHAVDFYKTIQAELKDNLLANVKPATNNCRGRGYEAKNVTDDNWETYWATTDSVTTGELTFDLKEGTLLNRVMIQEYIPLGQRVKAFGIEVKQNGEWHAVEANEELTTIGYKRLIRFKTTEAEALRIRFIESRGPLCINNVAAYLAPALLDQPKIVRNEKDEVSITVMNQNTDVYYTIDGEQPTATSAKYEGPFVWNGKVTVKAMAHDGLTGKDGPVVERRFDLSASEYLMISPREQETEKMFDGSGFTTYYLPKGQKEIALKLAAPHVVSGFVYVPNQNRDATGHMAQYELWIDGKKVAEGEFSNIKHNPIEQEIRFSPVKGQRITLKCLRTADDMEHIGIGEFSVITDD